MSQLEQSIYTAELEESLAERLATLAELLNGGPGQRPGNGPATPAERFHLPAAGRPSEDH